MKNASLTIADKKRRGGVYWALSISCFITILAQIEEALSPVFMVFWLVIALYLAFLHRREARLAGMPFAMLAVSILLFIYCAVCYLAFGEIGYLVGFCQLFLKCLLMFLIGFLSSYSRNMTIANWKVLFAAYVVASCIYMGWTIVNFFPGFDAWLSSEEYLFGNKNSLGQIVGVAAVSLMVLGLQQGSFVKRTAMWILAGALACCVLLIQCRTAFLACCLVLIYLLVVRGQKKVLVILGVALVFFILISPDLQGFFSHAFLLDQYEAADINTMSSGRLDLWAKALGVSEGNELLGIGDYYVDNLYIDLYVNLGIIGFILVMCAWVPRVIVNIRYGTSAVYIERDARAQAEIAACLTIFYLVESLLEGYPPFGPGTCSFLFWMLCGYLDGVRSRKKCLRKALVQGDEMTGGSNIWRK